MDVNDRPPNLYGLTAGVGSVKQEPLWFSSTHKNGAPMISGRRLLIWMMVFPGTYVLADISEDAA